MFKTVRNIIALIVVVLTLMQGFSLAERASTLGVDRGREIEKLLKVDN